MKKTLLLLTACAGMASVASAQVSFGLKSGVNLPKIEASAKAEGMTTSLSTSTTTRFYVTGFA